jgi:putative aminopeptidase FrvX
MKRWAIVFVLCSVAGGERPVAALDTTSLIDEVESFLRVPSVVGRELTAATFIRQRLGNLPVRQDALGNLTLTLGSGGPRRLIATRLDEPGYVVGRIQDDGYLRLNPVGRGYRGALWDQFHEGQKAIVCTEKGLVRGAMMVPSSHLRRFRHDTNEPFSLREAFVDVGAASRAEVAELGIEHLDPVTLIKRPVVLKNGAIAGPSSQTKAASVALVHAARRLAASKVEGTVVLAWTVLESLNRKGLEAVVKNQGPFDEAYLFSRNFGFTREGRELVPADLPEPGAGVLAANPLAEGIAGAVKAPHAEPRPGATTGGPDWHNALVGYLGLPSRYQDSPVELVHMRDVRALADTFVEIGGGDVGAAVTVPELPPHPEYIEAGAGHEQAAAVIETLVAEYGVSGAETPVRKQIRSLLPEWAHPEEDDRGDLWVTMGEGAEHIVFVAHMDEVGFRVETILEDGRLELRARGGASPSTWEAHAALVHGRSGDIAAVFEPRRNAFDAKERYRSDPLTVYLGTSSRAETEALGIEAGVTTVTMPKHMVRIGNHRSLARSLDDRAGCAALLLAMRKLEKKTPKKRVTFAWSVGEEVGMTGAKALAERFQDASRVYPIDTFVSSDAPLESDAYAYCPLGQGSVVRVLESINFVPRYAVKEVVGLAKTSGIAVQTGMTSGGTDGQPFLAYGIVSVPLSWPGRYSHSPVEVLDLRDFESLVDLIAAIAVN